MKKVGLDSYIIDTLMPDLVGHDHHPAAFLVFIFLWRQTGCAKDPACRLSLREISEGTGLSKRAVQSALGRLVKRRLIRVGRKSLTAVPEYGVNRPWVRLLGRASQ